MSPRGRKNAERESGVTVRLAGLAKYYDAMASPTASLTSLNLSNNILGARGGAHIGRGLSSSVYIRELRLRGCRLGSVGSLAVAKGLCRNDNTLCLLDLSENLICQTLAANTGGTFGLELHAVRKLCDVISMEAGAKKLDTLMLAHNELDVRALSCCVMQ